MPTDLREISKLRTGSFGAVGVRSGEENPVREWTRSDANECAVPVEACNWNRESCRMGADKCRFCDPRYPRDPRFNLSLASVVVAGGAPGSRAVHTGARIFSLD